MAKVAASNPAMAFLEKITEAEQVAARYEAIKDFHAQVTQLKRFSEIRALAASMGYRFTKEEFDRAMKSMVERSLEASGIPIWITERVGSPAHD